MAYSPRYPGGFVDNDASKPVDDDYLNAVEAALIDLDGHVVDAADAHDASAISFSPVGTIAATNVQAAIAEAASEAGGGVPLSVVDAAGDLIVGSGADTVTRLAKGSDGQWLKTAGGALVWTGIAASDIASGTIVQARLGTGSDGSGTHFLADDQTYKTVSGSGGTVYRKTAAKDVSNTVVETDLLNGEITLAAGVLSTNKKARCVLIGDYLNNTGAVTNSGPTLRIKLGGTTIYADKIADRIGPSATRRPWRIELDLANLGSAAVQYLEGSLAMGSLDPTTTGIGGLGDIEFTTPATTGHVYPLQFGGSGTVDTSSARLLEATIQWAAASASFSFRLLYSAVEVV